MRTALIVIDMQVSLVDEGAWRVDTLIERVAKLVETARRAEATIVYVKDRRIEPNGDLHPAMDVRPGDIQVEKSHCDAFVDTPLHSELNRRGVDRLVVAGQHTDYCIDTTCRRAASLGYEVLLVGDAHSTLDRGGLTGEQIVGHHNRILEGLTAGMGSVSVVESKDVTFSPPTGP